MTNASNLIAAPKVESITFDRAISLFGDQVVGKPAHGQRNHSGNLKQGRSHIQVPPVLPSTQAILHAGMYEDDALVLLDGYHRMLHWINESACPFDSLILIIHQIEGRTAEAKMANTDSLSRTIDSRRAVKTNADRWFAGMRETPLKSKSRAYSLGDSANAYLHFTIGDAQRPLAELKSSIMSRIEDHQVMDKLFLFVEQHVPSNLHARLFHSGVALAVFDQLGLSKKREELIKTIRSAMLLASGYEWANPPKPVADLAASLKWVANDTCRKRMLASTNCRIEYYCAIRNIVSKSLIKLEELL